MKTIGAMSNSNPNLRVNVTKTFLPPQEDFQRYLDKIWQSGQLTNQGPLLNEFEDKIKITSISQTTFINNFKEFFKKNRGNINQFLIEKSNGDDSNNIESCI